MKEKIKNIKKNKTNIFLIICIIIFIINTLLIISNKILSLDNIIHNYILTIRHDKLTNILLIITNISSAYSLIAISIILLLSSKKKKIPLLMSLNLICSFIINQVIKMIIQRPRPLGINLITESGFSYPSGHSMVSMAYFGYLIYLIYKSNKSTHKKTILISIISIIIVLIGFSRIYLGVHYFTDVIGGFLLSYIYLYLYIKASNKIKIK